MAAYRVTNADLDRWVREGIITPAQRDAVLHELEAAPATAGGIELTALLYYGGGLLVLLAYSVFLGLQWQNMNDAGRIAISGASLVAFAAISQVLLRSGRFQLPGELLQVVAVSVVPLLAFALLDAAGFWPDDPGYSTAGQREAYQLDLAWARVVLATATLIAAGGAFAWSRSPFVLIAALISCTALITDVSFQVHRPGGYYDYEWSALQSVVVAAMGAAVLVAGVATSHRTERDYTTWLYVAGLVGLGAGLVPQAFPSDTAPIWGALWIAIAVMLLGLSIQLQQRLFAVAGLAAIFAYLAKLVFDVFESANAALVLVVLGLLVLATGMLYQRYNERLFSNTAPPSGHGHA